MESWRQVGHILCPFLLTLALLTTTTCDAFRLRDLKNTIQHIPLKRVTPEGGFRYLGGANSHFDKELKELHEFRVRRSAEGSLRVHNHTKITEEFELKGDNHTVAFLHWAGKKSSVIYIYTCGKVNQTESEHVLCEDAYFWRSTDYGSTFNREDYKFKSKAINNVDFCPSNNKKVIVSVLKPKTTLYISEDEGETFQKVPVNFSPHVISCNPVSDKLIVAHDQDAKKVYYFSDGGTRWKFLADKVLRHYWGSHHVEGWGKELFLEVQGTSKYTSVLKHAKLPCVSDSNCVQVFDKSLEEFMSNTLEVEGRYVFVQKDLKLKGLHVFYQNGSDSNTNFFQLAQFPLNLEEKSYKVVDASENEMMVVVRHETDDDQPFYNLYVSDVTGTKYSLSLNNILSARTEIWGQNTTLVDIHRVKGLNGTYLANVYVRDQFSGAQKFRSVITFNKGGDWFPLKAPRVDHNGNPTHCNPPNCALHIHIVLSHWYYYIPSVLSSESAVGIIIAQGNLGNGLGEDRIGVFLSNDGGMTWTKEFDSFHDFVIGDHGGIIAAVSMRRNADKVWYSCTEGKAWSNVTIGSKPVVVYGMVTEPGETTLIFNLFGQYASQAFQWLSVKLNFTSVLDQKCQIGNYTYWSPNDERVDGHCLLGQHIVFERRKSGDCCFNGDEYEREINITTCTCEIGDFACDFGYETDGLFSEVCVSVGSASPIPAVCPEGKTYQHTRGYRKVIGDLCKGGVEEKLMPETRPCPTKAPAKLKINFDAVSKTVEVHKQVHFNLSQKQGSTESTWYAWDFGDNSTVLNKTGLSNAEHVTHTYHKNGDFVVRLIAANKAGQSVITADIIVKDPITSLDIEPPHAVVIGQEAWFNVTIHSYNLVNPDEYSPSYGFVHFMWIFEKDNDKKKKPLLTWDREVSHTFSTPGTHDVSVTAVSVIGQQSAHVTVTVYEDLTTVRLSFDLALDEENDDTMEWRDYFSKSLQVALSKALDVDPSRLEVVVLRGKPTRSDVSITPAPKNSSKTRAEIVRQLKKLVYDGALKIQLPKDITIRVVNAEVLPNREFDDGSSPTSSSNSGLGTRLAIGVGIAASLVVIFLVVTLLYFLRRYNLLRSRYTHLRLYSDGAQLRDPLIEDESEDEQSLHPQPGGSLRYVPIPTSTAPDPESDEELIDNLDGGSVALMPAGQNGQVQGKNVHV